MQNVVPREGAWWYCNWTKTEVQLPAAIKAKLMRQMLVQEKEVWFGCSTTGENGGLLPQRAPPLFAMEVHHAIQVMSERERASKHFLGLGLYEFGCEGGQVLSKNGQLTFQTFTCFRWVHFPANPFFPWGKLTGLFVQHLPLHPFDFYGTFACLPLVPPPIWSWMGEGEGFLFLSNYLASFLFAWSKNLSWLSSLTACFIATVTLLLAGCILTL